MERHVTHHPFKEVNVFIDVFGICPYLSQSNDKSLWEEVFPNFDYIHLVPFLVPTQQEFKESYVLVCVVINFFTHTFPPWAPQPLKLTFPLKYVSKFLIG
jgi:hypothetical protein